MERSKVTGQARAINTEGSPSSPPAIALRPRQVECLRWIAFGKTSAETAMLLGLSYRTVEGHVYKAFAILGVTTRPQAVAKALALRLI